MTPTTVHVLPIWGRQSQNRTQRPCFIPAVGIMGWSLNLGREIPRFSLEWYNQPCAELHRVHSSWGEGREEVYSQMQLRPCFRTPISMMWQKLQQVGFLKCFRVQACLPSPLELCRVIRGETLSWLATPHPLLEETRDSFVHVLLFLK